MVPIRYYRQRLDIEHLFRIACNILNFEDSIHIITEFKKNENGIVEIVDDVHPELNWDLGETSIDADAKMISFA